MFIARFFKYSVDYKNYFDHVKEKGWKIFIFFLLLSFINLFPMNYLIVREDGWQLDFIEQSFINETPDWVLPETCYIALDHLVCETDEVFTYVHEDITYVFNYQGDDYKDATIKQVLFAENDIIYTNGEGNYMIGRDYSGFTDTVNFKSMNLATGEDRALMYQNFAEQIESTFGSYIILYSVLTNTVSSLGLYAFFVVLMAGVTQLFRFGYSSFMNYFETMKMVVYAMALPAVLSFIVGFIEPTFSPVIFQFGIGVIVMWVMLKYGKSYFK